MPESELGYFMDALEWVSNPDADSDGALFEADATCVVYLAPFLGEGSWTSIVRRIDQRVALPYMIFYLAMSGVLLQVQLPLCIRDQDLDGRTVPVPRRSFVAGEGGSFELARALEFRVSRGALGGALRSVSLAAWVSLAIRLTAGASGGIHGHCLRSNAAVTVTR